MEKQRSARIVVYVEPLIERALRLAMEKNNETQSSYVRSLLINELIEQGLLTERMVAELAIG